MDEDNIMRHPKSGNGAKYLSKKIFICLGLLSLLWLGSVVKLLSSNDYTVTEDQYQLSSKTKEDTDRCLSFEADVDHLIAHAKQIYVTMPNKCAGSAMKDFLSVCEKNHEDGILRGKYEETLLSHSMDMPTIIADHAEHDFQLLHTIDNASSDSLIIFIYRDEPSREASAIKHVVLTRICKDIYDSPPPEPKVPYHLEDKTCVIEDEKILIDSVIKPRYHEIGFGNNILSCSIHEAIEKEGPNMIMVHYKQVDRLQRLLAKHRCPGVKTFRTNKAGERIYSGVIKLNAGGEVSFDDWVESKKGKFGLLQPFKKEYKPSCKAKTRKLENAIQSCNDAVIRVSG